MKRTTVTLSGAVLAALETYQRTQEPRLPVSAVIEAALHAAQRATAEDVPVKGNFVWSAMDNLEWTDGYGTRFGMIYVDFETQKRTPKLSAHYYAAVMRENRIV